MPRPAKGIRLWLRPEERNTDGTLRKRAVRVIRDGSRKISTGCAAQDRTGAERAVGEYLANKYQPNEASDERVVESLYRNAINGNIAAQCFWLKNRRPSEWRDVQHLDQAIGTYIVADRPLTEQEWIEQRATVEARRKPAIELIAEADVVPLLSDISEADTT